MGKSHRSKSPSSSYLVVVVQPDPLECHDLLSLLVLGLEHRAVRAWKKQKAFGVVKQQTDLKHQLPPPHLPQSSLASRTSA